MRNLILLLFAVIAIQTSAQLPQTTSFQGVLTDMNGDPVPDGLYDVTFRIYDMATGGMLLWEESRQVQTRKGVFSAILGDENPLELPFDKPYWLGISVDGGAELSPRTALTAVPYSFTSVSGGGDTDWTEDAGADVVYTGRNIALDAGGSQPFRVNSAAPAGVPRVRATTNDGIGLHGISGIGYGIRGETTQGIGVHGINTTNGHGILGEAQMGDGVRGMSNNASGVYGESQLASGIWGISHSSSDDHAGVTGRSTTTNGVIGRTEALGYSGVYGISKLGDGVFGLTEDPLSSGVVGTSENGVAIGVTGTSTDAPGVYGRSENHFGVEGRSDNATGVYGYSETEVGVYGNSPTMAGVHGYSENAEGVFAESNTNYGIIAQGLEGAGRFQGDVRITDMGKLMIDNVPSEDSERVLVWADDKYVKWRPASEIGGEGFNGLLVGNPLVITTQAGDTTTVIEPDGTSYHHGDETFYGNVIIESDPDAIIPTALIFRTPDGEDKGYLFDGQQILFGNTTDAGLNYSSINDIAVYGAADSGHYAGGFYGDVMIQDGQLIMKNTEGDTVFLVDSDGNSLHAGRERFTTGIDIGPENTGYLGGVAVYNDDYSIDGLGCSLGYENNGQRTECFSISRSASDWASFSDGNCGYRGGTNWYSDNDDLRCTLDANADPVSGYILTITGNVMINGFLEALGKNFVIDHPLEPETKTLRHYSVESDEMRTVYDGTVVLDANGEAEVQLPNWFEALNKNFRYQLTCIGGFANVYIAEKITGNQFRIAGGFEGLEVSWQVTGVRHDPAAEKHWKPVVEDKRNTERSRELEELRPPEVRR